MSTVVYKFPINNNSQRILLPADAKPLKVAMQYDTATMWVQLDPDAPKVERCFEVYGTGHPIGSDKRREFIDTYFDGPFVFHVFEVFV